MAQIFCAGLVDEGDFTFWIDPHDARTNTCKHSFGEMATAVHLTVGIEKRALLFFDLGGHAVKGAGEVVEFFDCAKFFDTGGEISCPNTVSIGDEF